MAISSTGLGSGLDVTSIISQLVALEKQPLKTLELKATAVNAQVSALGDIKSQFSALTDVASRISTASAWSARNATSSNTSAATITASGTASATSFTLDVDALAQKQSSTSAQYTSTDTVGAGTMTFRLGAWTTAPADSNAGVIAANATLVTEQGLLATATADKAVKDAALVSANSTLAAADAALLAPTAASNAANGLLATANATLATATSTANAANSALSTANATLASATVANANAIAAKATADANMAAAPAGLAGARDTANANLAAALATKVLATGDFNTANSAFSLSDLALATANTTHATATTVLAGKTSASGVADASRDAALAADQTAMNDLAASVVGSTLGAGKDYSDAYSNWVGAVVSNDHSTQGLMDAEATALVNLTNKRNLLDPSQLAAVNLITAAADATDASALKGLAISASAAVSTATTALSNATTAVGTATTDRTAALATLTTMTSTLLAATDAHATAFASAAAASAALANAPAAQAAAATAANDAATSLANATSAQSAAATAAADAGTALGVATADKATAQGDATTAAAALLPFSTARTNAFNSQIAAANNAATAATTFNTKAGDVAAATTARDAAVTAANALLPVFTSGASSTDVVVTSTASDTVATLAAKINLANAGVVATVFNDGSKQRLLLTSKDTGADAGFRVQVADADGVDNDSLGLSKLAFDPQVTAYGLANSGVAAKYGQDAKARINGLAVTSATNTFTDNVPGVTIKALAITTSSATMTISEDVTPAVKNVNDFVAAYNTLNKTLADLTKYDAGTKTASLFQADSSILGLQSVLRNMLGSISSGSTYVRLSDIGMERKLDGSISINTSKLSTAANNGTELQKLFTSNNSDTLTNGFALKFAALGTGLLAAGGAVTNKASALGSVLARNAKDQAKVNERATAVEARLRKTYSALDTKMASLTALNSYVAQQVTTWNKSTG
jgi:flagellar hook-associated protein 2